MKRRTLLTTATGGVIAAVLASAVPLRAAADKVLRVGLYRPIPGVDPSTQGGELTYSIFEALTTLDADARLQPGLAKSWVRTDDLTWTFQLHDGVTFSDGSPLDAAAVKAVIDEILDPNSTLVAAPRWRPLLAGSEVIDPLTVSIRTKTPYLGLPDRVTTLYIGKQVAGETNIAKKYVGSGPYVLQSVELDNGAVVVRNPHFSGEAPEFDRIEYSVLATEEARVLALQANEIDIITQIDPRTIRQLAGNSHYRTGVKPSTWNIILRVKETRPDAPLADLRVRQALNYGIDKQAIIQGLFGGGVEPSPGQFLVKGWDELNPALSAFPYDPDKARKLLADAGHAGGLTLRLDVPNGSYLAVAPAAQVIAAQLAEIGVKIEINTLPFPAWVDLIRKPDGDLVYIGHSPAYRFTPERLTQFKSSYDQSHWQDPAFDAAADRALAAQTAEDQRAAVDDATRIFHDNLHAVFLYPQPVTWAVRSDLNWEPRIDQSIRPQFARITS